MTTITQKEAYELAVRLAEQGASHKKISMELARRGWVSRKTGKALGPTGISVILKKMKTPGYKPINFTITKYAKAHGRYKPRANGLTATVAEVAGAKGIVLPQLEIPTLAMGGALEELTAMSAKFKKTAAAIDTLIDAVK